MYVRRLSYLHVLLKRPTSEITRKVYDAMKISPLPGDWIQCKWIQYVKVDFKRVGLDMNDTSIKNMKTSHYKHIVKNLVWKTNIAELEEKKINQKKFNMINMMENQKQKLIV